MNDIFANTETMKENEHPRFYTAESVMRGHPDKLCDLIADSVLDACLQHDPASRVACEVMATHGHIIVAGEITTSAKPDVFNIVRDTLRDVGYDPKAYQIDCYIYDQSPDIAGAVEPELAEGEDEDTLGAGDQGVMVGYACNETPEYLPMPVVAAQRLVTLLEISRMTGVIPDIGPDGKVQVTMEYNATRLCASPQWSFLSSTRRTPTSISWRICWTNMCFRWPLTVCLPTTRKSS